MRRSQAPSQRSARSEANTGGFANHASQRPATSFKPVTGSIRAAGVNAVTVNQRHPPVLVERPSIAATQSHVKRQKVASSGGDGTGASQAHTSSQGPTAATTTCFKVLYTKRAPNKKKKNKTYQDGILKVLPSATCVLYDDAGNDIARKSAWKGAKGLKEGDEMEIGGFEVDIDEIEQPATQSEELGITSASHTGEHAVQCAKVASRQRGQPNMREGEVRKFSNDVGISMERIQHPVPEGAFVLNENGLLADRSRPVYVDQFLARALRPHQKQGVKFLYECVMGLREQGRFGCILADEMGLGKTLQVISLIWTLLKRGPKGAPEIRRVIVVVPSSLVRNWEAEFKKWLGDERLKPLAVHAGNDVVQLAKDFKLTAGIHRVLVVSYETIRKIADELAGCCDVLICDEGHRLKSAAGNKTIDALEHLACPRRILLTGTPIQNALDEYFGLLGSLAAFKKYTLAPIQRSRDREATGEEKETGKACGEQFSARVSPFVLRRTSEINAMFLPPLSKYAVFCKPTAIQTVAYKAVLNSRAVSRALEADSYSDDVLRSITMLRKLCNHPDLLYTSLRPDDNEGPRDHDSRMNNGPVSLNNAFHTGSYCVGLPENSGKMHTLQILMRSICLNLHERVVVVSNSTKTLDIISQLCNTMELSTVRIDGKTDINARQQIVNGFNKGHAGQVFLLSTRAGGAGLNLTGANRLVLFDSEWNPAIDEQAMARIWRDGQKKACVVYRLLTTGTIDEKIFQRQLQKGEFTDLVNRRSSASAQQFTREELSRIFTLLDTECETADIMHAAGTQTDWRDQLGSCSDGPLQALRKSGLCSFLYLQQASAVRSEAQVATACGRQTVGPESVNDKSETGRQVTVCPSDPNDIEERKPAAVAEGLDSDGGQSGGRDALHMNALGPTSSTVSGKSPARTEGRVPSPSGQTSILMDVDELELDDADDDSW